MALDLNKPKAMDVYNPHERLIFLGYKADGGKSASLLCKPKVVTHVPEHVVAHVIKTEAGRALLSSMEAR